MKGIIRGFLEAIFYPFYTPFRAIRDPQKKVVSKVFTVLASLLILLPAWVIVWGLLALFTWRLGQEIGLVTVDGYIAGTGSMYPTFPKGEGETNIERMSEVVASAPFRAYPGGFEFLDYQFLTYQVKRGDIVSFSNDQTKALVTKDSSGSADPSTSFIKRVVGLPGDSIEIRDGFVYLNGEVLDEPYTASARSTYGGAFLPDCRVVTVPEKHVFVLGDNRKGSDDSRFSIGFVSFDDINSVIPLEKQSSGPGTKDLLKKNWRDTSMDRQASKQPIFSTQEYLNLLNQKRVEESLSPLKLEPKLYQSALKRAEVILKYNDLSFEATRSGYTMEKAMRDSGYSNIVYGEAPTLGYYNAQELFDNYLHFPETKEFLLNKDYQETGIATKVGEINGCPVQVVVQHFAGYIPPNYSPEESEGWQRVVDNLNSVIPSWEKALEYEGIDKNVLTELINAMKTRRDHAQAIATRMQANQWLTEEEKRFAQEDSNLYEQIEQLARKLNSQ